MVSRAATATAPGSRETAAASRLPRARRRLVLTSTRSPTIDPTAAWARRPAGRRACSARASWSSSGIEARRPRDDAATTATTTPSTSARTRARDTSRAASSTRAEAPGTTRGHDDPDVPGVGHRQTAGGGQRLHLPRRRVAAQQEPEQPTAGTGADGDVTAGPLQLQGERRAGPLQRGDDEVAQRRPRVADHDRRPGHAVDHHRRTVAAGGEQVVGGHAGPQRQGLGRPRPRPPGFDRPDGPAARWPAPGRTGCASSCSRSAPPSSAPDRVRDISSA